MLTALVVLVVLMSMATLVNAIALHNVLQAMRYHQMTLSTLVSMHHSDRIARDTFDTAIHEWQHDDRA